MGLCRSLSDPWFSMSCLKQQNPFCRLSKLERRAAAAGEAGRRQRRSGPGEPPRAHRSGGGVSFLCPPATAAGARHTAGHYQAALEELTDSNTQARAGWSHHLFPDQVRASRCRADVVKTVLLRPVPRPQRANPTGHASRSAPVTSMSPGNPRPLPVSPCSSPLLRGACPVPASPSTVPPPTQASRVLYALFSEGAGAGGEGTGPIMPPDCHLSS